MKMKSVKVTVGVPDALYNKYNIIELQEAIRETVKAFYDGCPVGIEVSKIYDDDDR